MATRNIFLSFLFSLIVFWHLKILSAFVAEVIFFDKLTLKNPCLCYL